MEPVTLSQIFDDPLFNDISESFLDDIDVKDLFDLSTFMNSPDVKNEDDITANQSSGKTTLESLLHSKPASDIFATNTGLQSWGPVNVKEVQDKQRSFWEVGTADRSVYPQAKLHGQVCGLQRTFDMPHVSKLLCDSEIQSAHNRNKVDSCPVENPATNSSTHKSQFTIHNDEEIDVKVDIDHCEQKNGTFKRAPHNAIEKRYRASINGKIDELRKLLMPIPSSDVKMNKSAVLRRAIDRIRELEEINAQLNTELMAFRSCNISSLSFVGSNNSTSETESQSIETPPVSLTNQKVLTDQYYFQCKTSPQSNSSNYIPVDQVFHFTGKPINQPSQSLYGSNEKEKMSMKTAKEFFLNSFHSSSLSSASSSSLSSPPSINSPLNNSDKFMINSQYSSVSPPSTTAVSPPSLLMSSDVVPSAFMLHNDSYDIHSINNENLPTYEQQKQQHQLRQLNYLSLSPLLQSPNVQNCNKPPQFFCASNPTVISPEQSAIKKSCCDRIVHRKRLANDSNGGVFTPTKAKCNNLLVNHDMNVKSLVIPRGKEKFNLLSNTGSNNNTTIQAQFPTVCQLLCETNACSHSSLPVLTKGNIPNENHQHQQHSVGYNEVVARTTLCIAALCLIALNPAQITTQVYTSSTPKDTKVSNARTLLSYFDTSSNSLITTINIPNSWLTSLMYILQWFVALLLCSWACYQKHIPVYLFNWLQKSRSNINSLHQVKSHFRQANIAINQLTLSIADYHLKVCLHLLGCSTHCKLIQPASTDSLLQCTYVYTWSIIKLGINLFTIISIQLPYWIWMCYFKKKPNKSNSIVCNDHSDVDENDMVTAAEVRLRLMELYLFDYEPKKVGPNNTRFSRLLDIVSLALMGIRDFLDSFTHGICRWSETDQNIRTLAIVDHKLPINLLPRQGVTLGLLLKRKLGLDYLGSLIIRMTVHVTLRFRLSKLWINWFNNSTFVRLIVSNQKLNSCTLGIITTSSSAASLTVTAKSIGLDEYSSDKKLLIVNHTEKNIINQILIELREYITCHCLKVILYGEVDQVKILKTYIHLLLELSPSLNVYNNSKKNSRNDEIEYEETDDQVACSHWWAQMLNILWEYRCAQSKLPLQSSCKLLTAENQLELSKADPVNNIAPQSLFKCPCLGDLVRVLSIVNKFGLLESKPTSRMLQIACLSIRNLRKSCRNLNNTYMFNRKPSESELQLDYMRFNFLAWSMIATNWFIDVLILKLKNVIHNDDNKLIMMTTTIKQTKIMNDQPIELFHGFSDSLYLLHQLVDYFNMPVSNWIRIKLRSAEAVHRLITGACPTRTRFALLQNYSLSCLASSTESTKYNTNKSVNDVTIPKVSHNSGSTQHQPICYNRLMNEDVPITGCRSSHRSNVLLQSPGC
ncbi:Sterol regulatory element-binding protein [Schistosoma japonicum]|uniref:Sterol regulatory element-binding protein n=1 Tax=Schistosoma japonicum TaxID=6182 RepID=A0A4Z2D0P6_SCHJA|nr:Sterol regulatory element-binding protein [Schistosoma japonicum]